MAILVAIQLSALLSQLMAAVRVAETEALVVAAAVVSFLPAMLVLELFKTGEVSLGEA
jgi:hypothetical protein